MAARKSHINRLCVHTSEDLPLALLISMIEQTDLYRRQHPDLGRLGIMGLTAEAAGELGYSPRDMENRTQSLRAGTARFRRVLRNVRQDYPAMPFRDWYLLALACYWAGYRTITNRLRTIKTWMDVKIGVGTNDGIRWAENVWNHHLTIEGKKVL